MVFKKCRPCALDERSLSIGRVNNLFPNTFQVPQHYLEELLLKLSDNACVHSGSGT